MKKKKERNDLDNYSIYGFCLLFVQQLLVINEILKKNVNNLNIKAYLNCQLCTNFIHLSFIYKHIFVNRYTLEKEIAHSMSQIPCIIKGNLRLCAFFLTHDVKTD